MSNNDDIVIFKEEILKNVRTLEEKLTNQINTKYNDLLENIESYQMNFNRIIDTNKSSIDIITNQKLQQEKINDLINFKNKVDAMLITHEIRINNSQKDIEQMRLKYDKIITENLLLPGYIGTSCQYKNVSECLLDIIQDLSRNKFDKENMKKDMKEIKNKYDSLFKTMVKLNDVSIIKCKEYTDSRERDINNNVEIKIKTFDEKIMEIRMLICTYQKENKIKFSENDEKIKKLQEEKLEIIKLIEDKIEKIKKFEDLLHKKIVLNIQDISINKNKIITLENETNQSIKDIFLRIQNIRNSQINRVQSKELMQNNPLSLSPIPSRKPANIKNNPFFIFSPKHEKIINFNTNNNEVNKTKFISKNEVINPKNARSSKNSMSSKNSGNSKNEDEDDDNIIIDDKKILNKINIFTKNKVKKIINNDYNENKTSITYNNFTNFNNNDKKEKYKFKNNKNRNISTPSINITHINTNIKQQNDDKKINNEITEKYYNYDNTNKNKINKKMNKNVNKSELYKLKASHLKLDSKSKIINTDFNQKNLKEINYLLEKQKNNSIININNINKTNIINNMLNNNQKINKQLSEKIKKNLRLYDRLNKKNILDLYSYSVSPPEGMDLNLYSLQNYEEPNFLNSVKKLEPETGTECNYISLGMYNTYTNTFKNPQKGIIKNDKGIMYKTSSSFNQKDIVLTKKNHASWKTLYAYYNKKDKDSVDCSKKNKRQKSDIINNAKNFLSEGNI